MLIGRFQYSFMLNLGVLILGISISSGGWAAGSHVADHLKGMKSKIVTLHLPDYRAGLRKLIEDGYDVAGVDVKNTTVDVLVAEEGLSSLQELGLGDVVATKSIDPELGPDARYTTHEELTAILENYSRRFPEIFRFESIGKSHEGRDIWAVKISDNVDLDEDEPAIFFNAMHHAREVMTTEVAIDIIEQLTTGYSSNDGVNRWVNGNEIWVVPMVNPDGNNKVWTSNSMWRKNTRDGYGVDINRNYPYAWGSCGGSSGSTWSDTYRGPSAGSEPETQAVMGLVSQIQPVFSVSYHSYSEIVIYPYGCDGERAEERQVVESLGQQLAGKLVKDGGSGVYDPGTSWELLYAVDGGDIDWYYNAHHVIPYVIEVNSGSQGFQPPYSWRQSTVERMRPGWALMLDRLEQSGVRGQVTVDGQRSTDGTLTVTPLGSSSELLNQPVTHRLKNDGSFHVVLDPGMYKLTVSSNGAVHEANVTVGAVREEFNFDLSTRI